MLLFHQGMDADSVRKMADAVMQKCKGRCAVFSENPDGSYRYAVGEKNGDLRQFIKEMNQALNGRGGGRPFFAQGSDVYKRQVFHRIKIILRHGFQVVYMEETVTPHNGKKHDDKTK